MTGTPIAFLDYSDPKWADQSFDYGKGWAGNGFGLSGTQRGAPERIEVAEVDGVTALRFHRRQRNESWHDDHPNAENHGVYGSWDTDRQDDFFLYRQPKWTAEDEPYLFAQLYLGNSRDYHFTSLRMPEKHQKYFGGEERSWPGIFLL